jgi:hypothetical protein
MRSPESSRASQEIDGARSAQVTPLGACDFGIVTIASKPRAPILVAVGKAGDAVGQSVAKRGAGIVSTSSIEWE